MTLQNLKTAIRGKKIILFAPPGCGKGNRSKDLQALVKTGIVEMRGVSGVPTDVETAKRALHITQMHAMSDRVYQVVGYNAKCDEFLMKEVAT